MNSRIEHLLQVLPKGQCIVLFGASEVLRNGDVSYVFRQDSDFLYLTGLSVPDLVLTIFSHEVILWREPITSDDELWGHAKLSDEQLASISGIDIIRDLSDLESYQSTHARHKSFDPTEILHRMRSIKTPDELECMKRAIFVTNEAFSYVESRICAGMYEYEIEAMFAYVFRKHGLTEAYPTIVASGPNACILHYTRHTRQLEDGDLVLIDAGAEYQGYASDWTRTFKIGQISNRKRSIIDAVERIKAGAETFLKPGIRKSDYEQSVRDVMIRELEGLGLIDLELSPSEKQRLSKIYFPHSCSHLLGLDVHDVGQDRQMLIEAGMVFTIEPGIYIREEGIGVRIEDDYLVTDTGCTDLASGKLLA